MKYIFAITLFVAVGAQTFSKWIIILGYECNKEYIAKNLCVNRKMPGSCCKGKCYLHKKLATDEDQQVPAGKPSNTKDVQPDFFVQSFINIIFSCTPPVIPVNSFYTNGSLQDYTTSFFSPHPCFPHNQLNNELKPDHHILYK